MTSQTEQGKVQATVQIITNKSNSEQIQLIIPKSNDKKSQEYIVNKQNKKCAPVYYMQGDKLLRIQINNVLNQEERNNQHQLEVKSVAIRNDNTWKEVEKITQLLDFSETAKSKEIEIFYTPWSKIMELQKEKQKLQEQLNTAKKDSKTTNQKTKQEKNKALQDEQKANAKVEELEKKLAAKNTEVQQLQQKNKELEAQKQPTEQPKPGKAPTYTAVVGVGLAAGLVAFTALDRTVRLDMWIMVGIALASALAVSGATYLALKPSTQVSETQEPQKVNGNKTKLA